MKTPAPSKYQIKSLFNDKKNYSILAEKNFSRTSQLAQNGHKSLVTNTNPNMNLSASFDKASNIGSAVGSAKNLSLNEDRVSFGAPRECFNNVVGPNNFNYLPFKASMPGPGKYGTGGNPFREIGGNQVKAHRYSMASRKKFCHQRDEKHSKSILCFYYIFLLSLVYKINDSTPGPGAYNSISPRMP